jgi:hypothetical protein
LVPCAGEPVKGIGDGADGVLACDSGAEATLELEPSTFDFLKRLRRDSLE